MQEQFDGYVQDVRYPENAGAIRGVRTGQVIAPALPGFPPSMAVTYGILRMHNYMEVVGRATQDAKAEEQFEGYVQDR